MLHSKKKIKESGSVSIFIACAKADNRNTLTQIQKGKIMRTVLFANYLNNEYKHEALVSEQSLDFMRSYKIREKRRTVTDFEGCPV